VTPGQTILRYHQLLDRYGTEEERALNREMVEACAQMWRDAPPGSLWEPMSEVYMPGFLRDRARRVARERHERAARYFRDRKGARRTLEQETHSVLGQYAAALILGLSLNAVTSEGEARKYGNLGSNVSAFIPRAGSYHLIVGEKEPPSRTMVLIYEVTDTTFSCPGWILAAQGKQPEWQRRFVRNGVESNPYLVPPDALWPLADFFAAPV